jgi:deoxyribodipyrimidine photo-lyase
MLGYLLDGDVASNHLSWQWVAGTGSTKPYLFNADNVAKYAPQAWHSPGTVIDTSYESLDRIARSAKPVNHRIDTRHAVEGTTQPALTVAPPGAAWSAPDRATVVGRDVWLLHPWSLGAMPRGMGADGLVLGVGFGECHAQMPWSERRWHFVSDGLLARTPHLWWGSADQIAQALQGARSVGWQSEPHADGALEGLQARLQAAQAQPHALPRVTAYEEHALFEPVGRYCESFSQWWRHTRIAA